MNINLKQLETFVWVADLGSFRRAAERMYTTQPNISSRIASLESALGVTLMERDAGSVRLTPHGFKLLAYARGVLNSAEAFIDAANNSDLFDGVLRLGVTEMVVHTWLPDFLKVFKKKFPNVLVELSVDVSVNLEHELSQQSIDLAFQNGPFSHVTTGEKDLGTFPIIWVASPKLGLSEKKVMSSTEMAEFPIFTHAKNTRLYRELVGHFSTLSESKVRIVPSSNLLACMQMMTDGYGIAAVVAPMVLNELQAGELIKLNYDWAPESLSFSASYDVHRRSRVVNSAAEVASSVAQDFTAEFQKISSQWIS